LAIEGHVAVLLQQLRHRDLWVLDTEYIDDRQGAPVLPVCLTAVEIRTGRVIRQWADEAGPEPPFPVDGNSLAIVFFAAAEWSYFRAMGWRLPEDSIDLFAEYRCLTNGRASLHPSLLEALASYGLPGITKAEKTRSRDLVLRGRPWSLAEQREIIEYCLGDTVATARLFLAMLPAIEARQYGIAHSLLRGAYAAALALVEHRGVPVSFMGWERLRTGLPRMRSRLIETVNADLDVFEGENFRFARFEAFLARAGIVNWPRTETGQLKTDSNTLGEMVKIHPATRPLRDLLYILDELKLADLAVGQDGRNRVILGAFGSITGRNQPSASRYIFGPAVWLRSLIQPDPGKALFYWSSQELWVAGALSGDEALLAACRSGDPYMAFAVSNNRAPPGATKRTHPRVRELAKVVTLAMIFGQTERGLGQRLGLSRTEARGLIRAHQQTYPAFWRWSNALVDRVMLGLPLATIWGWQWRPKAGGIHPETGRLKEVNDRSARNWPMQAHGAEMLRAAVTMAAERGLEIVATVHDALLVQCDHDRCRETAALIEEVMGDASAAVLDGIRIKVDVGKPITWPNHFMDVERGVATWKLVHRLLAEQGL
jgi:hypothetical protein